MALRFSKLSLTILGTVPFSLFSLTLKIAKILLANGADPNGLNRFGESPLFEAVRHRKTESVQLLIDHGARVNVTDYDGFNLLRFGQHFPEMGLIMERALKQQIAESVEKAAARESCDVCKRSTGKRCTGRYNQGV